MKNTGDRDITEEELADHSSLNLEEIKDESEEIETPSGESDDNTFEKCLKTMGIVVTSRKHYVNNEELYNHFVEYCKKRDEALVNHTEPPQLDDYIGEAIMKIATHLAFRPNFSGYSYRSDMIGDAIETCVQYLDSFDPNRSKNIFAYITQICWRAFIRRLKLEKKQNIIRGKIMMNISVSDEKQQMEEEDLPQNLSDESSTNVHTFITLAEEEDKKIGLEKEARKKEKERIKQENRVPTGVEQLFVEDQTL